MKRFIIRTFLLIILPVLLGIAMCEYFLRKIPNDYSYKNEWLINNAASIKVLNMGSSHAFFGIKPSLFSFKAFNAAHVSQSLKYDHFIFSKFVNDMDSLKILVLPISYFSFTSFGPENGIEDWRVKYYSIYYGCKYHRFEPKYNLEVYNDLHLKNVLYSVLGKANHRTCDDFGWGTTYKFESRSNNWEESGAIAAKRHTNANIDMGVVEKNKRLVEEMVNNCSKKGIKVLFLTLPTYQTYRDNIDQNQLELMEECCDYFVEHYDNLCYLNLFADTRFQPDDFFDADHLNEFGAEKVSRILNDYCNSIVFQK